MARTLDEPLHATASLVRSWILLEQPGAWGRDAITESALPADVALELKARAQQYGVRVLLLRRPDRAARRDVQCFVAHSGRGQRWIEQRGLAHPRQVLDVDFARLAGGERTGFGALREERLYLVCTNGRHDPCCARLGRPLVRSLLPRLATAVWECSHVGGDRFAGNLVCLPDGLYFGRVGPAEAPHVVESYEGGFLDLDHYRGRAGDPYAVQAAEYFVRRIEGLRRVDEVVPESHRRAGRDVVEVDLAGPGRWRFRVVVRVSPAGEGRPLTCAGLTGRDRPPTYSLVSLVRLDGEPAA